MHKTQKLSLKKSFINISLKNKKLSNTTIYISTVIAILIFLNFSIRCSSSFSKILEQKFAIRTLHLQDQPCNLEQEKKKKTKLYLHRGIIIDFLEPLLNHLHSLFYTALLIYSFAWKSDICAATIDIVGIPPPPSFPCFETSFDQILASYSCARHNMKYEWNT